MSKFNEFDYDAATMIDFHEIEMRARQMRGEAIRSAAVAVSRWVRGAFSGAHIGHAAKA